mgnify:CR=1 FL=1
MVFFQMRINRFASLYYELPQIGIVLYFSNFEQPRKFGYKIKRRRILLGVFNLSYKSYFVLFIII